MKRNIILFAVLIVAAAGAFGQQFNLTGQWSIQNSGPKVLDAAQDGLADHKGGVGTEYIYRNVGIGSAAVFSFDDAGAEAYTTNWDLRAFMSYHFMSRRAFLDPFIQAGGGAYGSFDTIGDWCDEEDPEVDNAVLGFYPYLAAGLGFQFRGGLYASGQYNWRPVTGSPGCCEHVGTPAVFNEHEVVFSLGYAFGGQRR